MADGQRQHTPLFSQVTMRTAQSSRHNPLRQQIVHIQVRNTRSSCPQGEASERSVFPQASSRTSRPPPLPQVHTWVTMESKNAISSFLCIFELCIGKKRILASSQFHLCLQLSVGWCVNSWESFASTYRTQADLSRKQLSRKGETPLLFFISVDLCLYNRADCGSRCFTRLLSKQ